VALAHSLAAVAVAVADLADREHLAQVE